MNKKVLLYSGGLDSYVMGQLWHPDVKLYVNTKGRYSATEMRMLPSDVKIIDFPLGEYEQKGTMYIPLRNLYFLMLASNYGDYICLGATAGDYGSRDKTPEFLMSAEAIINDLLGEQSVSKGRHIEIEKGFIHMSKGQLIEEYLRRGGNVNALHENTFSCFNPDENGRECLSCKPCFRRFSALYNAGYRYSSQQKLKMAEYIKTSVLPRSTEKTGTYYADRHIEGEENVKAVNALMAEIGKVTDE